ncbi:hypothetical protein EC844_103109 [Acinetobacter calcoaceticus]|uniref:Uncharacterized protein n=1 Tax=Acinetobacter calcoaceticus TaxID=471 RepID=A0A4R1XX02_ACICA|nr:hypothetical protein EC844_103109 [Acinetobacter calcoaceticus]
MIVGFVYKVPILVKAVYTDALCNCLKSDPIMTRKLKYPLLVSFTLLGLSACTLHPTPSTTQAGLNSPKVLEQHRNIQAEPATMQNRARLIQQQDNCVIEFKAQLSTGQATEYWIFKSTQLISAITQIQTETENIQRIFDLNDPQKQANFKALQNNFKKKNLEKCN